MLTALQKVLSLQMTVAEWIGTALLLSAPYLVIGGIWSATHADRLTGLHGFDRAFAIVGLLVSWPLRLYAGLCTT